MRTTLEEETGEQIALQLVRLLHQGTSTDEFTQCMVEAEALPAGRPGKSNLVEAVRMAMAVRNRLELLQQRESGMLAVIESAQELSSRLDLNSLLGAIVARARKLLGSDLAWLSVHDPVRDEFRVLVAQGAISPHVSDMVTMRGRGVAGVVMSTRLPFTTADYLHDTRFTHDAGLDEVFREDGIAALVGVPLIWEGEVIGLLFVADRYHRVHTTQSLSILCTLATHGAVALKNARDFEALHAALGKADAARAELERHLRGIQTAADAHEQMTSLLARGASLSTLCQSVAELLGGSLLVLDEAAQPISQGSAAGYAGQGAQGYEPHGARSAELAQALRLSRQLGRSVEAYAQDGECCRVMPVIGGDDVLGAIALFHRGALEEVAVRTFERSSSVIGIVLLSQERMEAARSRNASALLRTLVSPRQDEAAVLLNRAERLGLDLSQPLALLLVELEEPGASYAARHFRAMASMGRALVDEIDGTLVILCAAPRAFDLRQEVSAWARRHATAMHRGVLSRPAASPAEIPALYATLRRALGVLGRLGVQGQVLAQNELALYSALFETHDQASLSHFLDATIGPLIAHDRKRNAQLASTLLCYFDCNQNAKTTAQRLGIHVNTVRQRLASIEEMLGHWGNAARALEIHMALRLWSLIAPAA
ncbi:helix-turn-helix domain-containing protein [Variovorax sp. OV329]|uniref:helix-turn-helix domain-containing protein n=1 Tax=Variovorax sp. OV329 TaxID=1882825 RepID=UPI0008E7CAB0|nr:helix-turn-helix domain-containing protein [Variovorax sp. OV329]SFM41992.1 Sugar diacid utilization regulator [Variovorax sp. OV329]